MRAISIQVQPERSKGLDLEHLDATCAEIAATAELVAQHRFDHGHDRVAYMNFTFGTEHAASLWRLIQARLYDDEVLGPHMRAASMVMCSSTTGWDDYLLLYHFDPGVKRDPDTTL